MRTSASGRNAGNVRAQHECYERFLVEFEEKGYSDKFEFLDGRTSNKGKVRLRCRICGHEFEKFGSFCQQSINIRCDKCHVHHKDVTNSPRDGRLADHVLDEYRSGESVKSVAKKFGVHERYVSEFLKESGIDVKEEYKKRLADGTYFEILSHSYEPDDAWYVAKFGKPKKYFEEQQKRKAAEREKRERDAAIRKLSRVIERYARQRQREEDKAKRKAERERIEQELYAPKTVICKHCGKEFVFYPSRERYGRKNASPLYCSRKCLIAHNRNRESSNIGHRLRKYGLGDKPRDAIKLQELIKRDHCICQICGKLVDREDHWIDEHGYHVCGGSYPSIDHIIPLVRGGTHTWDNVQLAHRDCNSWKESRLMSELEGVSAS